MQLKPAIEAALADWAEETFELDREPDYCTATQVLKTPPPSTYFFPRFNCLIEKRMGSLTSETVSST